MSKLSKILKVSLYVILFLGLIAAIVCYCVIPDETRLAMDKVIEYVNTPIGITGVSIAGIGYVVFKILSTTTFGKKGLGTIKNEFDKVCSKVNELENSVYDKLEDVKNKAIEQKELLTAYQSEIDEVVEIVKKICETSPNAKIKAIGNDIDNKVIEIKEKTIEQLAEKGNELAETVQSKYDFDELKGNYDELKTLIAKLEEQVAKLSVGEEEYGEERETTEND